MSPDEVKDVILEKLLEYRSMQFTGQMTFRLDCRMGGVGKVSLYTEQEIASPSQRRDVENCEKG